MCKSLFETLPIFFDVDPQSVKPIECSCGVLMPAFNEPVIYRCLCGIRYSVVPMPVRRLPDIRLHGTAHNPKLIVREREDQ